MSKFVTWQNVYIYNYVQTEKKLIIHRVLFFIQIQSHLLAITWFLTTKTEYPGISINVHTKYIYIFTLIVKQIF